MSSPSTTTSSAPSLPEISRLSMLSTLRRGSAYLPGVGATLSSDEHDERGAEPPIEKELLEKYGTRLQNAKASLAQATKRVLGDDAEFHAMQNGLRQGTGRGLLTDAWLKQNMMGVLHRHAKALEARKANVLLQEVNSTKTVLVVPPASPGKAPGPPVTASPTSVMNSVSLEQGSVSEHFASPPLVS